MADAGGRRILFDRSSTGSGKGFFLLTLVVLAACLLLGGATRPGYLADALAQLVAVPLLLWSLWRLSDVAGSAAWPLAFCAALVLLPLVQLVPLPPSLWPASAGRDAAAAALELTGQGRGWRPLSLTPHGTWLGLAALVPALAVFLATLLLSLRERRIAVLLVVGLGGAAGFLGLLQASLGVGTPTVQAGFASPTNAHGLFVNRNHFAALLYCLLPFAAAFAIDASKRIAAGPSPTRDVRDSVLLAGCFAAILLALAALIMARSRAGIGLSIVALFGIAAMASSDRRDSGSFGPGRLIGTAVALVGLFASQFALYRLMQRFELDPLDDARVVFARVTWDAALTMMPFGAGIGAFVPVYQSFEKPADALVDIYANRAHNDVLDVGLETGIPGLVLIALFLAWVAAAFWRAWREEGHHGTPLDRLLMRAATLAIVLLLAHSLVDYPLRTTAMAAVFALACGVLVAPRRRRSAEQTQRTDHPQDAEWAREDRPGAAARAGPSPPPGGTWAWPTDRQGPGVAPPPGFGSAAQPSTPGEAPAPDAAGRTARWGADIAWPEEWRRRDTRDRDPKTGEPDTE